MLLLIFCGTYLVYFAYVRNYANRSWKLRIDRNFQPKISILIPVHDEESSIESKLENVKDVSYPRENMEIIVADDASEDKTLAKVDNFLENNPSLNVKIVGQNSRAGKSAALNKALDASTNQIVIVSDADTQWPLDILQKALPYLSDPKIGAVTGRGINLNADESWVTKSESTYLHFASLLRLGESKIHSTIKFEGGFCAYKKNAFKKIDIETGADDSGTALEVVQNGYRSILAPEIIFYTVFPASFASKLRIKARRANQLVSLCVKCFGLLLKGHLVLPKRIAVPEMMLFILNPIILLASIIVGAAAVVLSPFSLFSLVILFLVASLLLFARKIFFEILLDNLILLYALIAFIFGRRYVVWEKCDFS
jgi:cellulose synthase/poly-beta-1,6-N-acetylglucosamine synthase-like glycosyltransferase